MNIILAKDYEAMSQVALSHILAHMYTGDKRRVNLSITGGSTPKRLYELLTEAVRGQDFSHVHYYNFDEIPTGKELGITLGDLTRLYFDPAGIDKANIEALSPANWEGYDRKIEADGGLDMILMGLGGDGHFCGNIPGTIGHWGQETRKISRGECPYLDDPNGPDHFVTFGPKTVMHARHAIMIINGSHKAEITKAALFGEITPDVPASILQLHPNYTVILDEEAAALL